MRIHLLAPLLAPLLFPLFLGGCDEKSHDMPAPAPDTRRIVDLTTM